MFLRFLAILAVFFLSMNMLSGPAICDDDAQTEAEEPEDEMSKDLEMMQGKWERKADAGIKFVQIIEGNTSVMEIYQAGRMVHKQTSKFELRRDGPVKINEWEDGKVIAGPRIGQTFKGGKIVYRIDTNRMTKVTGLLKGEKDPVSVEVFYRSFKP